MEHQLDYIVYFMMLVLLIFCFVGAVLCAIWVHTEMGKHWYLGLQGNDAQYTKDNPVRSAAHFTAER